MNILITGAGGYIGSTLTFRLLSAGYEVRAIDRYLFGKEVLNIHPNLEIVEKDTRELEESDFAGIDYVVDLAALSNDSLSMAFEKATLEVNYQARARNAQLAQYAGVRRYILGSSCSVYGYSRSNIELNETNALNPLTTYALSNVYAEQALLAMETDDFTPICLRQSTIFGLSKRMRFDLVVNIMTYNAWNSRLIKVNGDGKQWRPLLHVLDAAYAIQYFLELDKANIKHRIYNVGSQKNNINIREIADIIVGEFPEEVSIIYEGAIDARSYRVNFDRLTETGFLTRFSVVDGVKEILQALDDNIVNLTKKTITLEYYKELERNGARI